MTRAKVSAEQRQRIAQACDSCKKRKQKCNGENPCNTCRKRSFTCLYTQPSNHHATYAEKVARRKERHDRAIDSAANLPIRPQPGSGITLPPFDTSPSSQINSVPNGTRAPSFGSVALSGTVGLDENMQKAARSLQQFSLPKARATNEDRTKSFLSIVTGVSGNEGEGGPPFMQMRMLQDPSGRLLFLGESATVTFLQILRALVDPFVGSCPFVDDPRRHMITEPPFSLDPNTRISPVLPDEKSATILAHFFFDNTHGLINVFERSRFMSALHGTYEDPLLAEPEWLCQINLVFAIGLMLATPKPGTEEFDLIEKMRGQHLDRAEAFFLTAKGLCDPQTGFEDGDFWSIQALLLMSVYMLTKSKRNNAFAHLGMAVRSAYALGLHREDTLTVFSQAQQTSRRNLWKSLFVMDRFLALSLGRHPAIYEDEAYSKSSPGTSISGEAADGFSASPSYESTARDAMEAAVQAACFTGRVLKRIYQRRQIRPSLAHELATASKDWAKLLPPNLGIPSSTYPSTGYPMAALHVNLMWIHGALLLTRPFFQTVLKDELDRQRDPSRSPPVRRWFLQYSQSCLNAATHTVAAVKPCLDAGILPARDPLVTYCVASASLVILANDFARLHKHPEADTSLKNAFKIMAHCATMDSQASRLHYIMGTFVEANNIHKAKTGRTNSLANQLPPMMGPPNGSAGDMPVLPSPSTFGTSGHTPSYPATMHFPSGPAAPNPFASSSLANYPTHSPIPPSSFHTSVMKSASSTPTPLDPPLNPSAPPNPLSPAPNRTAMPNGQLPYDPSSSVGFASLLDFASPFNTDMNGMDDGQIQDEQIDFDVFWTWNNPSTNGTAGMSTPGAVQPLQNGQPAQTMVPLYGLSLQG